LLFIYLDAYLQLGNQVATIFLGGTVASLIAIPLWLKFIQVTNKKIAWALSMFLYVLLILGFLFTGPGDGLALPMFLTVGLFFSSACQAVVAPSVLADVVDYGTWKFGRDRGGAYFAFYMLITKANIGLGAAAGFVIAGLFGFDAAAIQHDDMAIFGMRLAFIILPALCILTSIAFILLTPITPHRHQIIRKRIENRINGKKQGKEQKQDPFAN